MDFQLATDGHWYTSLTNGRRDALRRSSRKRLANARKRRRSIKCGWPVCAERRSLRGIELGVGGWQPSGGEVFVHRYGDCKDKATLMSSMLHEIGVDSYYVVINAHEELYRTNSGAQ